ncbi:Rad2 nuclease [Ascosphaera aggregata]|nr:Rad2 nuclease [Ascosphaera aggregata]
MGIAGEHVHRMARFKGQTVGVDAYSWLHKGVISCVLELALGKPTRKYVDFALNRIHMLLHFGIVPYVVFDGDNLPSKATTEEARAAKRERNRRVGLALLEDGRKAEAYRELQGAIDVTPAMAQLFIDELRRLSISYVVAPYEADAQLVYLESCGLIDAIISEDSDLLVFGAKRLISKLDKHGDCIELDRADFGACKDVSLVGWSDADFRAMCILSGCDYLQNIPGMGLKTAYRSLRQYKSVERVVQMLRFANKTPISQDYLDDYRRAEFTFLYQRVFCPIAQKLVTLRPIPPDLDADHLTFIGDDLDPGVARGVASGDLHPNTKEPIERPRTYPQPSKSQINRRRTLPADNLKHHSSIDTTFTPKRVPLATIDPNIFTPTASQEDLLRRNSGRSWSANATLTSRMARPKLMQKLMTPSQSKDTIATRTAMQSVKRTRDPFDSPGSDSGLDTPSKASVERKSRFFANTRPSLNRPRSKTGQSPKKPRIPNVPDSQKNTTVGVDGEPAEFDKGGDHHITRVQQVDETAVPSTIDQGPPAICFGEKEPLPSRDRQETEVNKPPESEEDAVERHIKAQNLRLLKKYGYDSSQHVQHTVGEEKRELKSGHMGIQHDSLPHKRPVPSLTKRPTSHVASEQLYSTTVQRTTPLQRLKRMALSRSRSLNSLSANRLPFDVSHPSQEKNSLITGSVIHRGSEDMIIPKSEDEEESPDTSAEEDDRPRVKSVLQLKDFLFNPRNTQ